MKNAIIIAILLCTTSNLAATSNFHVAIPIGSGKGIVEFYGDLLGAEVNRKKIRETETFSINLDGHSLVMRVYPEFRYQRQWMENDIHIGEKIYENVDAQHFGLIVTKERWLTLRDKILSLQAQNQDLVEVPPFIKNEGKANEVGFMLLKAPSGYTFELKYTAGNIHTGVQEIRTSCGGQSRHAVLDTNYAIH